MKSNAIVAVALVASALVGASVASGAVVSAQPEPMTAGTDDSTAITFGTAAGPPFQQGGQITGENVTISRTSVTNVTLQNVYVTRLVANATRNGSSEAVEFRNVSIAEVRIGNGSLRNLTFDTVGLDREFSTDLLGQVGTGTDPENTLPSESMEARNLSDRTITGVEFGRLEVSTASVRNVSVEDGPDADAGNVTNATVSGQGVTAEAANVSDVTVVGWSANETEG